MSKTAYTDYKPQAETLPLIADVNVILERYARQGYIVTLRTLYYQMVTENLIPNDIRSYKRLVKVLTDARLGGYVDWDHLTDEERNVRDQAAWASPQAIMEAVAQQYRQRVWNDQPEYIEVWIEKNALAGVVGPTCTRWRVPLLPNKGYLSISEMHDAALRFRSKAANGQRCTIIHLGDHDPSGVDMSRDIEDRMTTFQARVKVERIALNLAQIRDLNLPPNPAKVTDIRHTGYVDRFGDDVLDANGEAMSWELDALSPDYLDTLIQAAILRHLDRPVWDRSLAAEVASREDLEAASERWPAVTAWLRNGHEDEED